MKLQEYAKQIQRATPESLEAILKLQEIIDKMNVNDFNSEYELMEWVVRQCKDTILILSRVSNENKRF